MTQINPIFFKNNREKFAKLLKNNSIACFFSSDKIINGDDEDFKIDDKNLFYLTNISQKDTKLLIIKTKEKNKQITKTLLFVKEPNKKDMLWNNSLLDKNQIKIKSKILKKQIIYENENNNFEKIFKQLCEKNNNIYFYENQKKYTKTISEYELFIKKTKQKFTKKNFLNSKQILTNLREIKQNQEIKQIKKCIKITQNALENVLKNIKKIKNEKEIEAILIYNYTKNFAQNAFFPIIASNKNSCILHYNKNSQKIKKNSLILIDTGAQINNYKSDISRTFPLNGKFTKRQKQIYKIVLDIQKYAISQIKIGIYPIEYETKILKYVTKKLINEKIISKKEYEKNKNIIKKYYPHSTSHFLGLETHDVGNYLEKFKENQIITVEPGIYIKEENLGIRIEDNILITKKGAKILSKNIPKTINQIEKIINKNSNKN